MTAYKESCIHIACCLSQFGPLSPKSLRQLGTGQKTQSILSKDYYDWFDRIERGTYVSVKKDCVSLMKMRRFHHTIIDLINEDDGEQKTER